MSNMLKTMNMRIVNDVKGLEEIALHTSNLATSPKDGEVILCNIGKVNLAVGDNADLLYMHFGWNITEFQPKEEKESVAYIVVTDDGLCLLRKEGVKTTICKTDYVYEKGLLENDISSAQQFIDLFRYSLPQENDICIPFVRNSVTLEMNGYMRTARLTALMLASNHASVILDNKDYINLVEGNEWNFGKGSISILEELAKIIETQHDYMSSYAQNAKEAEFSRRKANGRTYEVFRDTKTKHDKEIVLIKEKGYFVSFDDDAVAISIQMPLLLYNCETSDHRHTHTAIIISLAEFYKLTGMDFNIYVINDVKQREVYTLSLMESYLNGKSTAHDGFTSAAVYKLNSGDYALRVVYEGRKLPETQIDYQLASYYQSLPNGSLEKRRWLSAFVYEAYDETITQMLEQ